jgi:hypothetical protein
MKLSLIACASFFALAASTFATNASGADDTKNGVIGKMETPIDASHGAVTHRRQHGLITMTGPNTGGPSTQKPCVGPHTKHCVHAHINGGEITKGQKNHM